MTGYIPYIPSSSAFKLPSENKRKTFYPIQQGRGDTAPVKIVSPTQEAFLN